MLKDDPSELVDVVGGGEVVHPRGGGDVVDPRGGVDVVPPRGVRCCLYCVLVSPGEVVRHVTITDGTCIV